VHDARARLSDMDIDGTWASLCFPSLVFGFAGKVFAWMGDREAALASVRAWNDWMLEEWCGAAPERYIPCQLPWLLDPEVAAGEVRRNAARGFRAVTFSENPEGLGLPSIHTGYWDPFLAACAETGTVVNLHVGSSGNVNRPSSDSPREAVIALFPVNGMFAAVDWLFSKIPVRFPDIRICLSEAGASWVPMVAERLARAYRQIGSPMNWTRADGDPVEVLRCNFRYASLEDPAAFRLLDVVGEDNVMVEADYPHPDSVWPDTQELIRGELSHLTRATIRKVCYGNAAALYRHPLPPQEMIANSAIGAPDRSASHVAD
jgi:predicted TIM-barrel fold metal-dependent hydrolase